MQTARIAKLTVGPVHPHTNAGYVERYQQRKQGSTGIIPKAEPSDLLKLFPPPPGLGKKGELLWAQSVSHYDIGQFSDALLAHLETYVLLTLKLKAYQRELKKKDPFLISEHVNNRGRTVKEYDLASLQMYRIVFVQWRQMCSLLHLTPKGIGMNAQFDQVNAMTAASDRLSPRAHLLGGRGRQIEGEAEEVDEDNAA